MEQQYLQLVRKVLTEGERRPNRTGTDTLAINGAEISHDLRDGFPLLTTKKMYFKGIEAELVGFILGLSNAQDFADLGTKIWLANANDAGLPGSPNRWLQNAFRSGDNDLGRIYGVQWRSWRATKMVDSIHPNAEAICRQLERDGYTHQISYPGYSSMVHLYAKEIDQFQNLIDGLKNDPYGRRHLVWAWNPGELDEMALPPCHIGFECWVSNDKHLDLTMTMRSTDVGLGLPYNIASYAALTHILAELTDLKPRMLRIVMNDTHVYVDHIPALQEQLQRFPLALPEATVARLLGVNEVRVGCVQIHGYESHGPITMKMAT